MKLPTGRMLVGFGGQAPEDSLICYAAMVARLYRQDVPHHERRKSRRGAPRALTTPAPSGGWQTRRRETSCEQVASDLREVRFVSLLAGPQPVAPSSRAAVAEKVRHHFAALPPGGMLNVDLLKGRPLERLTALAADFDTDVLLLDSAADSRRKCARLAAEAPCAVWMVPSGWAPVLRRILVPIDFSYRAAASLQSAVELARRFRPAKCIALHVDQQDTRLDEGGLSKLRLRELDDAFRRFMTTIDVRGVAIEPLFVKSHHVDRAIERASVDRVADLTVMICRRRTRITSAIDSPLAMNTIRASTCPFLLLKSTEKPLELFEALRNRLHRGDVPQYT